MGPLQGFLEDNREDGKESTYIPKTKDVIDGFEEGHDYLKETVEKEAVLNGDGGKAEIRDEDWIDGNHRRSIRGWNHESDVSGS